MVSHHVHNFFENILQWNTPETCGCGCIAQKILLINKAKVLLQSVCELSRSHVSVQQIAISTASREFTDQKISMALSTSQLSSRNLAVLLTDYRFFLLISLPLGGLADTLERETDKPCTSVIDREGALVVSA